MPDGCWIFLAIVAFVLLVKATQIWLHHRRPASKGRWAGAADEPWSDPDDGRHGDNRF